MIDSTAAAILSQLRDAHMPSPPGWWPPAFGWWVLFFTITIGGGTMLYRWLKHRRQRRCPAWHALNELDELWSTYDETGDAAVLLKRLSVLMRRTAISLSARGEVAALTGDAWLNWLDLHAPGRLFTRGNGRLLAHAPYQPASGNDAETIFDACEAWLEYNADKYTLPSPAGTRTGAPRKDQTNDGENANEGADRGGSKERHVPV